MSTSASTTRAPSLIRLSFRYSTYHRRLAIYMAGLALVETIWFAFAGYMLRNVPTVANGSSSYAILHKCVATTCSGASLPPAYAVPISNLLIYLLPAVCALVFVGPSLAREFDTKSVRFSWTQGITRNQWLASRLLPGLIGALLISIVGEVAALRWVFPHNFPFDYNPWGMFPFRGATAVGIAVLLVAFSVLCSILLKRPLFVVLVTALAYGAIAYGVSATEPRLLAPNSTIATSNWGIQVNPVQQYPQGAQLVAATIVTKNGAPIPNSYVNHAIDGCSTRASLVLNKSPTTNSTSAIGPATFNQQVFSKCVAAYDFYNKFSYQPISRFWELQWIYAATTGAAGLVLIGLSFWLVKRVEP
ncbi:MAG: hypothetical protein HKL82_03525 [Acidimicrobiaceae bacterium]|nr:hypothetical protein [Acidimicrobiaceae bacterium]